MAREHPHGVTTFAGCQIRYLVGSAHGWLGAAGFSAAALRVSARDRWIAWSKDQRRDHLHRVVCLSRFLIRPSVRCPHLASHVLGRHAAAACRENFRDALRVPSLARGELCRCGLRWDLPAGGQLPVCWQDHGPWSPGPCEAAREDGEDGSSCIRTGPELAAASSGFPGSTLRQRSGQPGEGSERVGLGRERVWRGTLRGQAVVGAAGEERGTSGGVSRGRRSTPTAPATAPRSMRSTV